ncbi:MAG: DUF2807 domain-containing protein [Myxococcales bacterium]|nr:DUF2807 domain-containing protein [Myxococcales bacterium]
MRGRGRRRLGGLVGLGLLAACTLRGDGERASEERVVDYFDTVEVFDSFVAELVVDPSLLVDTDLTITVAGDGNALGRLFTGVHEVATLSVGVDPNHLTKLELTPELVAPLPVLKKLHAADAAAVTVEGASGALLLSLEQDATATVTGVTAGVVTVAAAGASALELAGEGPSLEISASGSAGVDARRFRAAAVTIDAQGTGKIVVCGADVAVAGPGEGAVEKRCE